MHRFLENVETLDLQSLASDFFRSRSTRTRTTFNVPVVDEPAPDPKTLKTKKIEDCSPLVENVKEDEGERNTQLEKMKECCKDIVDDLQRAPCCKLLESKFKDHVAEADKPALEKNVEDCQTGYEHEHVVIDELPAQDSGEN